MKSFRSFKGKILTVGLLVAAMLLSACNVGTVAEGPSSEIPYEPLIELPSEPESISEIESESEPEPEPEPEPVLVKLGDDFEIMSDATEADISGIDVSELDMDAFFEAMPNLERLTMKDCGLDNDGYAALQDAHPDVRLIWDIKLYTYVIPTDAVAFSTLLANGSQPRLYDKDTVYLKYCTDMVALDLGHNFIKDLTFLEYMPNLRILILVENYVAPGTRPRLVDISELKYTPHLRYLELFANDIKDMSVIADLKELEDLNICYNPTETIDPFRDLPNLQKFWVYGTHIPADQLQELREIYPNTRIVTSGAGSVDQGWRSGEHYLAMRNMVKNNVMDDVYRYEGYVDRNAPEEEEDAKPEESTQLTAKPEQSKEETPVEGGEAEKTEKTEDGGTQSTSGEEQSPDAAVTN